MRIHTTPKLDTLYACKYLASKHGTITRENFVQQYEPFSATYPFNLTIGGIANSTQQSSELALLQGVTCNGNEKSLQECRFFYDENNCNDTEQRFYCRNCAKILTITCEYNGRNCSEDFKCHENGNVEVWPEMNQPAYICNCSKHWTGLDCSIPICANGTPYNDRCVCESGFDGQFCDYKNENNTTSTTGITSSTGLKSLRTSLRQYHRNVTF